MPTTLGAILLLVAVFGGALYWASSGRTDRADKQGDVTGHPGSTS
jgi:hypothetical protein